MKKQVILLSFALLLILSGCAEQSAKKEESDAPVEEKQPEQQQPKKLTLPDVIAESKKASEEIVNFQIDGLYTTELVINDEAPVEVNMNYQTKFQEEPFLISHSFEILENEEGSASEKNLLYSTDTYVYLQNPNTKEWAKVKRKDEGFSDGMVVQKQVNDPLHQIETINKFTEQVSLEEAADVYRLSLTLGEEEMDSFLLELDPTSSSWQLKDLVETAESGELTYEYVIDKESFMPRKADLSLSLTGKSMEENISITYHMEGEYKNLNDLEALSVPENILQEAGEIQNREINE